MPGTWTAAKVKEEIQGMGVVSPSTARGMGRGVEGQTAPLSYLRSRNALKIILDLDEEFGRVKVPGREGWRSLPRGVVGKVTGA